MSISNRQAERWQKLRLACCSALPAVVFVILWHFLTVNQPQRQFIFSSPQLTWSALVRLSASGELAYNTGVTVFEAVCGFLLGTTIGAIIGLSLWYSKFIARISQPYITALGTVPIFALAPIIIVWFGIGTFSKIMLAFLSTVTVSIVQSYQGSMSVDNRYLKLMQVAGATRFQTFKIVVVPSSLIWVVNAMKLNIGLALLGAFIGEFISAESGLGYMIVKASGVYDMATVIVGILALVAVALVLSAAVGAIERRLLSFEFAHKR